MYKEHKKLKKNQFEYISVANLAFCSRTFMFFLS